MEASEETHDRNSRPLSEVVGLWRTPTASEEKLGDSPDWMPDEKAGEHSLTRQATKWSTPRSSDAEKGSPQQSFGEGGGVPLPAQAVGQQWMTPRVVQGKTTRDNGNPDKERLTLEGQAYFHQVHQTYPVGGISSRERRSLNPLFVEWLMGWPHGWTLLAWTDFACSEMELCLFKQHMRCALSQLVSPPEVPAQLGLFN